ncbi:MAG: hypothetical protein JW841_05745 [Deltaproteobacteria bacterium]|nr:hypothetical protein [Deltaproteobacteria bacterium]
MATERFGDPVLTPPELAPRAIGAKPLKKSHIKWLWGIIGCTPVLLASMATNLNPIGTLIATFMGLIGALILALLLSRSAFFLGIGSIPQTRAAFGTRGAALALWLRIVITIAFFSVWFATIASWVERLINALKFVLPSFITKIHFDIAVLAGVFCYIFIIIFSSYIVACRNTQQLAKIVRVLIPMGLTLAVLLAVYAIYVVGIKIVTTLSCTFPSTSELADASAGIIALALPGILIVNDWLRFQRGASVRQEVRRGIFNFFFMAFLLLLTRLIWAQASIQIRGYASGHPIPDIGAFGGIIAASAALLLIALFSIGFISLIGLQGTAFALLGIWPYPRRMRFLISSIAVVMLTLAVLDWHLLPVDLLKPSLLGSLLAGLVGILLADELLRRGRTNTEELFLFKSTYWPFASIAIAAVTALIAATLSHPLILGYLHWFSIAQIINRFGGNNNAGVMLRGLTIGALSYLVLLPLEHGAYRFIVLLKQIRRGLKNRRIAKANQFEFSASNDRTNPHFIYKPQATVDKDKQSQ